MNTLLLILACVVLGASGQIAMKSGMRLVGVVTLRDLFSSKLFSIILNPWVLSGIVFYGIATILWLVILSKEEVSFAYPMISLGYIITALVAWTFLGESLTLIKFLGILLVVGGVYLILLKI